MGVQSVAIPTSNKRVSQKNDWQVLPEAFSIALAASAVEVELLKNVLVIYYSKDGKTKRMAGYICESMCGPKVEAKAIKVEDFKVADLSKPDGLVIGSPTYFSNMAWQMKKLVDESICFYGTEKSLEGKVGGCFTSAGCRTDGSECLRLLELAFGFHHKMKLVPGLISDEDDKEEKLKKICNEFGKKIAEQINLQ